MGDIHGVGGPPRRALMVRAFVISVLLSVLFLVLYGSTNWFTAQRPSADVTTWFFTWELTAIPYVPLLIIPYMSMDLFFFVAPFLCRSEREMHVFAKRVIFAILIATAFFLLLPLKLNWPERPRVDGWFGDFVEQSCSTPFLLEYPHNLFPSLHITLCMIVADVYFRHTRGFVRVLLGIWFGLIALSALLTWQHHLVDLVGGFVLGVFAFYLFRESEAWLAVVPNVRVGSYYALGTVMVLALALAVWPWGAFLLVPAFGLGMVAGAYFRLGPGIYRKTQGRVPLSARFVMAPCLIGQYLSLVHYSRQCRAWDELVRGVLIGRALTEAEAAVAVKQGVTAVLDLTAELSEAGQFLSTNYYNLPILDLTGPTQDQLHEAVSFIGKQAANGTVYIHCKIGYSRSAAVAGAFLLASRQVATVEDAIARLVKVRPSIVIRPEAMKALRAFTSERLSDRVACV